MLYGLITAKIRQRMVCREAHNVVRVSVDFQTSYTRFIDVAGRGKSLNVLNCSKLLTRTTTGITCGKDVQHTWYTRKTHAIIRVMPAMKSWRDALGRESLAICHGQKTVIGGVLRVGITGNSVCLTSYHWQMDFTCGWLAVFRPCFRSGTVADGHIPYKARPSQKIDSKLPRTTKSTMF